jgi:peptidoglycan L-alanyl-D-glutamate endopeptidase CwlK
MFNREPKRNTDLASLEPFVARRVEKVLAALTERGFDPILFEARRSPDRQQWLYGVGRTHSKHRKPITWTTNSRHLVGKAADIISKSRGWSWGAFYDALDEEAAKVGMRTLKVERCHIEFV